jgi:exosortase/archaeosortase family protein
MPDTASTDVRGTSASTAETGGRATRFIVAALVVLAGIGVVLGHTEVRRLEAQTSAGVLDALRVVKAEALGSSVIFPLEGRFVGFTITPACTVALLTLPFFGAAALLIASRRVKITRALVALVAFAAVVFTVNQLRLAVAAGAMRAWGFETGYERSHVFLGTVVSTVGVLGSLAAFVYVLLARSRGAARHG